MNPDSQLRFKRIAVWAIASVFLLGFFLAPIAAFTGPILGAWFVGTQRLRRGFFWMLGFSLLFSLPHLWRGLPHGSAGAVLAYAGWTLLAMVFSVLPFTFYRFTSFSLSGFLATVPLPVFKVLFAALQTAWLPAGVAALHNERPILPLPHLSAVFGAGASVFLVYWFAATLVWAWSQEFRTEKIWLGTSLFAAICVLAAGFEFFGRTTAVPAQTLLMGSGFVRLDIAAAIAFAISALLLAHRARAWTCRSDTLAILRSPVSGEPLQLVKEGQDQALAISTGERIPLRHGIPDMRRPEDLTGTNEKYNHLYETIGGFYDDVQRIGCAFMGIDRDAYVMSYLGLLEIKPGDSVLETSVGTGLNFKYLPKGISLTGIDLSPEMLISCQSNLRRWGLSADLFLGNAECLPFADSSCDVVFHVGGINFFNDRARAIREMIRVAKPGSRILIADETEEHVKAAYERGSITGSYFKNRKQPVTAPVDLVPGEMLEIHLEILNVLGRNRFYVLTFRKPAQAGSPLESPTPPTESVTPVSLSR